MQWRSARSLPWIRTIIIQDRSWGWGRRLHARSMSSSCCMCAAALAHGARCTPWPVWRWRPCPPRNSLVCKRRLSVRGPRSGGHQFLHPQAIGPGDRGLPAARGRRRACGGTALLKSVERLVRTGLHGPGKIQPCHFLRRHRVPCRPHCAARITVAGSPAWPLDHERVFPLSQECLAGSVAINIWFGAPHRIAGNRDKKKG
jgi:hypothetical protein